MNLRVAILAKGSQAFQTFQFMPNNRHTTYLVGFMMNLQIIGLAAHLASVSVTNANLTLYFFPIRIILQALPILARSSLLVDQSRHLFPPFAMDFH